ncbi:MAG TPA: hypothetical protein VNQ56_06225 [Pseudolabrys sp.]|nr:hypothetical protein [Pseudolabrys sp.]
MHIARRKEIWERIREEETGEKIASLPKEGRGNKQFAAEVASVVGGGRNPESVKRDVQPQDRPR